MLRLIDHWAMCCCYLIEGLSLLVFNSENYRQHFEFPIFPLRIRLRFWAIKVLCYGVIPLLSVILCPFLLWVKFRRLWGWTSGPDLQLGHRWFIAFYNRCIAPTPPNWHVEPHSFNFDSIQEVQDTKWAEEGF